MHHSVYKQQPSLTTLFQFFALEISVPVNIHILVPFMLAQLFPL